MARRQPRWDLDRKDFVGQLRKRWAEAALKKEVGTGASSVAVRGGASTQWAITATWTSFSAFDATPALKILRHTYPRIRCGPSAALFPSITLSRATCRCILARTDPCCASFLNLLNKREICHSTLNRRNLLAYSIGFRLALSCWRSGSCPSLVSRLHISLPVVSISRPNTVHMPSDTTIPSRTIETYRTLTRVTLLIDAEPVIMRRPADGVGCAAALKN
jgi:hypothetical protein